MSKNRIGYQTGLLILGFLLSLGIFSACKPKIKGLISTETRPTTDSALFYADPVALPFEVKDAGSYRIEVGLTYNPKTISENSLPLHFILKGPQEKDQEDYNHRLDLKQGEAWVGQKIEEKPFNLVWAKAIQGLQLDPGNYELLVFSDHSSLDKFEGIAEVGMRVFDVEKEGK